MLDDQVVDDAALQHRQRIRQQGGEIGGDERPRTGIFQLVLQLALGIERTEVDHRRAGLDRPEEREGMQRDIGQIEPDRMVLAMAQGDEAARRTRRGIAELSVGDSSAAELDGRPLGMGGNRPVEHLRDRGYGQRLIPAQTRWIGFFPGEGTFAHGLMPFAESVAKVLPSAASRARSGAGASVGSPIRSL